MTNKQTNKTQPQLKLISETKSFFPISLLDQGTMKQQQQKASSQSQVIAQQGRNTWPIF